MRLDAMVYHVLQRGIQRKVCKVDRHIWRSVIFECQLHTRTALLALPRIAIAWRLAHRGVQESTCRPLTRGKPVPRHVRRGLGACTTCVWHDDQNASGPAHGTSSIHAAAHGKPHVTANCSKKPSNVERAKVVQSDRGDTINIGRRYRT